LIARVLVHEPQVLVLDEPSTALDFAAALTLNQTVRMLIHLGRDIVLVSHHPGEIPPDIRRVILIRDSGVFADGDKRAILTDQTLSQIYQIGLKVKWSGGWCEVKPV